MFNKNKKKIQRYYCKKCQITKFIESKEAFNGICKACGNKMEFRGEHLYNNDGLNAIRICNTQKNVRQKQISYGKPTITCPYCQSTNTSKISATSKFINTAVWGIFGTKRHKQWHCNDCGSDF